MSLPDSGITLFLGEFHFKGDRTYVQGADVLTHALDAIQAEFDSEAITDLDITFHTLVKAGLTLMTDAPAGVYPAARLSCRVGGMPRRFVLLDDGRPITERRPYPEEKIVAATTIEVASMSAHCAQPMPFTNMERWVAMLKALHIAVHPQATGKWLFTRARLSAYPSSSTDSAVHQIQIKSSFGGKMTRSALSIDNQPLGDIYFVLS